jgi:hypothetical protein
MDLAMNHTVCWLLCWRIKKKFLKMEYKTLYELSSVFFSFSSHSCLCESSSNENKLQLSFVELLVYQVQF